MPTRIVHRPLFSSCRLPIPFSLAIVSPFRVSKWQNSTRFYPSCPALYCTNSVPFKSPDAYISTPRPYANAVGYASAPESVEQFNFLSIGFNSIGYNTCDIQQIKISDGGAGGIGWGTENFALWAGAPDVVAGSGAIYYDPSMDPNAQETDYYWGDAEGNRVSFSVEPGQGVVIDMPEGLAVQMAGQVSASIAEMTSVELIVDFDHCYLDQISSTALDRRIHGGPLAEFTQVMI
jgi:hypothetical protein